MYFKDDESVAQNGLTEIKIVANEIMNFNDRSNYLQGIASNLFGIDYYLTDYSSTGILVLDLLDYYTANVFNTSYKCLMLNDEVELNQGLEEQVYTERPETAETDYTKADKTDLRINQTYTIVDKHNQIIQSVVSNMTNQNNKISRIEQTVDSLNSKISDIADITVSQETNTGKLVFTNINQSEPVHIEIFPIGESISCIYPRNNLNPSNNLIIQLRRLKFTNTLTGETFWLELPADLLYYDGTHYDTFIMDYDSLTFYINKKCEYDSNGNVVLLANERIDSYPYQHLEITDGNYDVEVLKYDNNSYKTLYNCHLFARLMTQNQYTSQYATKAEVHSEINQTTQAITQNVNARFTNYSTTTQMNSSIQMKANEITNSVAETYESKGEANSKYSQITQTADSLQSQINSNDTDISNLQQTADNFSVELRRKVNETDYTGASIVLKINNDGSSGIINADKISLNGKSINLTSDSIVIQSNNFNVDQYGNMSCSNANISGTITSGNGNIGGWRITSSGLNNGAVVINNDGSSTIYTVADLIIVRNYIMGVAGFELSGSVLQHYDFNHDGRVSSSDYVALKNLIGLSPE